MLHSASPASEMIALSLFAIAQRLEVGGDRVSLDDLGPVIVNKDCSLRRIENWGDMTEAERGATSRRVAKVCGCARNTHTAPHPPTQYDTRGISGLCHASDSARWR